jgi:hypothetical protein
MTDGSESAPAGGAADQLRSIERARLQALVAANMASARPLHAADFQLITPSGRTFSKEQYLDAVVTGAIHYLRWEPEGEIAVRLSGSVALVRYRAHLEMGDPEHPTILRCWHTDSYEKRDGRWQVVWSQATEIR